MGPDTQTTNYDQADAFFARLTDASPHVIAEVTAERGGNLQAVTAEIKAYGYWQRTVAKRASRQAARQRATLTARIAAASRTAHPDETARLAPLTPESAATLPPRRLARVTDAERRATMTYWRRLADPTIAEIRASTLKREARRADEQARRDARRARRAAERWRLEQRAFERAQWRTVLADRAEQRRKQAANQWTAISEERALEIAIQVLTKPHPPQDGK